MCVNSHLLQSSIENLIIFLLMFVNQHLLYSLHLKAIVLSIKHSEAISHCGFQNSFNSLTRSNYKSPLSMALCMSETSLPRVSLYSEFFLKRASRNLALLKKEKTQSIRARDFSVRCFCTMNLEK